MTNSSVISTKSGSGGGIDNINNHDYVVHHTDHNDSGGDLIKVDDVQTITTNTENQLNDDDGRSMSSLSLFMMQQHDDVTIDGDNSTNNGSLPAPSVSHRGIVETVPQQPQDQKRFSFYNAQDFVINSPARPNNSNHVVPARVPVINENQTTASTTTTTTKAVKSTVPEYSNQVDHHNKKGGHHQSQHPHGNHKNHHYPLDVPTIAEAILRSGGVADDDDIDRQNNDNHNPDSMEILKSLKEHEQQRLEILGGGVIASHSSSIDDAGKSTKSHRSYHNYHPHSYGAASTISASSTRSSTTVINPQDNHGPLGNNNTTATYNPYEDAIKEALLLLRKHRPLEHHHTTNYYHTTHHVEPQKPFYSDSRVYPTDPCQPDHYIPDQEFADSQLRIDTSVAMTPRLMNAAIDPDGHLQHEYLDPIFTGKSSASHFPSDMLTPSSDAAGTIVLGDAYQNEIEARRRQRQERMAKYASRLAELKQQEEHQHHNGTPHYQEEQSVLSYTTTTAQNEPHDARGIISATANIMNTKHVASSHNYLDNTSGMQTDPDCGPLNHNPPDRSYPRSSPEIQQHLHPANDFEYRQTQPVYLNNNLPTPDASISSYPSPNEREIQKGVERVLLAILERASSNSRGGGRSSVSSSSSGQQQRRLQGNRHQQQYDYPPQRSYDGQVQSLPLHQESMLTTTSSCSTPTTLPSPSHVLNSLSDVQEHHLTSTLLHNASDSSNHHHINSNIEEKKSANLTDDAYGNLNRISSDQDCHPDQEKLYYDPDDRHHRIDPYSSQPDDDPLVVALTELFRPTSIRDNNSIMPSLSSNEEFYAVTRQQSYRQQTRLMINTNEEDYTPRETRFTMPSHKFTYGNHDTNFGVTARNMEPDGRSSSGKIVVQDNFLLDTVSGEVEAVHSGGSISPGDARVDIHDFVDDDEYDDENLQLGGVQSHEALAVDHDLVGLDSTDSCVEPTISLGDEDYEGMLRNGSEPSYTVDRYQVVHDDESVNRRHLDDDDDVPREQYSDDPLDNDGGHYDDEPIQPQHNDYDAHASEDGNADEREEVLGKLSYFGVLGPLNKRPGGTTGVVLESSDSLSSSTSNSSSSSGSTSSSQSSSDYDDDDDDSDDSNIHGRSLKKSIVAVGTPTPVSPSLFQSLTAAVSLVTGVTSYDDGSKSPTTSPTAPNSPASAPKDKYYLKDKNSKNDDDENDTIANTGGSHYHSVESDDNSEDSEAYDLMRSLCAHLLPFGVESLVRKRSTSPRSLLEPLPDWDNRNPDEPGYRIVRLNRYQLSRVQIAYDKMIDYVRHSSQRNLLRRSHENKRPDTADENELEAEEAFERDLQAAEDLLDEEELRLVTNNGKSEVPHDTNIAPRSQRDPPTEDDAEIDVRHGDGSDAKYKIAQHLNKNVIDEYDASNLINEGCTVVKEDDQDVVSESEFPLHNFHGVKPVGKGDMGELEYFSLPIIFKSHVTGFEPTKDLVLEAGNVLAGQYLVEGVLGSAAFSTAYKCINLNADPEDDHERYVCLKVIKNTKDFFDQSLDEIKILELLRQTGKCHDNNLIEMKTFFYHREHLIIVTELLRQNLFEFNKFILDSGEEQYFTIQRLSYVTHQCLIGLKFVHELGLVHSDIKPENILLASYSRALVKIIDFGSSCWITDRQSSYIQSRSYRAPEVILGLPYDGRIDIWSLGCVVAEMYTGEVLFQNDSVVSMLCRIEAICGTFPKHMILNGRQSSRFFTKCGLLYEKVISNERRRSRKHDDDDEDDKPEDSYITDDDDMDDYELSASDDDDDDDHHRNRKKNKKKSSSLTFIDIFQPKKTTLTERLGLAVSSPTSNNPVLVEANSIDCTPSFFIDSILFPQGPTTSGHDDNNHEKANMNNRGLFGSDGTTNPSAEYLQKIFIDFVRQLLMIDPGVRLTANQALQHPLMLYAETLTENDIRYPSSSGNK